MASVEWRAGASGSRTERTGYANVPAQPIRELADHRTPAVRRWARRMVGELQRRIENARDEDAEFDVEWGN